MMYWLIQAVFICWIVMITLLHWKWFKLNWKTGPWFHAAFAALYVIPVVWIGWFDAHDWRLIGLLILQRFVFYNPLLNIEREEDFFYLSVNSKDPSWWDKIEISWGKYYRDVWFFCAGAYIILQFFVK